MFVSERKQIELELQQLSETEPYIGEREETPPRSPHVPRSERQPSPAEYEKNPKDLPSFLPKSGEQVLPLTGAPHPLVGVLVGNSKSPPAPFQNPKRAPTFEAPEHKRHSGFFPSMHATKEMAHLSLSDSKPPISRTTRNVLFIYPYFMKIDSVISSYNFIAQSILHPQDNLTILWAGGSAHPEGGGGSIDDAHFEKHTSSAAREPLQTYRVASRSYAQALETLRERCFFIHQLVTETEIHTREFTVKIYAKPDLRWCLQQEFQPSYNLVVLPCCSPEKTIDKSLEKFVLQYSPAPVVLIRAP